MPVCNAFSSALAKKGMNAQQLAIATQSDQGRISQICAGTVTPTSAEYSKIASALGLSSVPASHP
ncbi:uncharacterized protein F5891DRAFT_1062956 [Suillus fuscotomentosus]|uniref:HTH cro/C1-type domain-containing protein n=1 Tax=Suillus fuscotomentosus TaxID=1912939 RepID=A0AAD4DV55_9AGAM|nr:uncharacterized protein F5891DRAFT_1062956 [Suillus fuscotomentosus]KAG1823206.1 hypothetical protein EV424DRAFT_1397304 [Suillus variegatus]KAG1894337.1 hypothetical protein F5891DRAFT_1062956 [Suillus fuscotomentosus]